MTRNFEQILGYSARKVTLAVLIVSAFCFLCAVPAIADKARPFWVSSVASPQKIVTESINNELDAFRERDATRAYDLASVRLKSKYKTPLQFITMMRVQYWDIYAHASYRFLGAPLIREGSEAHLIQKIEFTTTDQEHRTALFCLTAEGGGWKIDHIIVLDPDGQSV